MAKLSIIVVTWNCRGYLPEFFGSLKPELEQSSVEIIVVDNASTDGTPDYIMKAVPEVTLIRLKENLGFARGNNVALTMATGEFVCLINPDVKVLPGCIDRMVEFIRKHDDVGLIGPRMLDANGLVGRSTMRFPTVWNYFCNALALYLLLPTSRAVGGYLMRDFQHDRTQEVEVLNGWFWMTRRGALTKVGGLDERFFMYGEDIDWCRRFQDAGFTCVYFADAAAIHYGHGSSSRAPIRFCIEQQRSKMEYFKKHYGWLRRLGFFVCMWLHHILRTVGRSLQYLLLSSKRKQVSDKLKESTACVEWLLGFKLPFGRR